MKGILLPVFLLFLMVLTNNTLAQAQDSTDDKIAEVKGAVDGINESMAEMRTLLNALSLIKVSGYIQSQYQVAQGDGIGSYAGGNFPTGVHSRFQVRRGRLKVNYATPLSQYVLQIDVTQNGVGIKDAYLSFKEPWLKSFTATAGVFDRPFGFEISHSSSSRETPERSRLFQTLFPGERDLGVKLEYAPETGELSFLNVKAGFFNGTGSTANENDNNKDFIGRAGVSLPFTEQNFAIDAGVSTYLGSVRSASKYIYTMSGGKFDVDSASTNVGRYYNRAYYGGDVELYYDLPVIGGMALRGEYILGDQPGTQTANTAYVGSGSLYQRKFAGFYLTYLQNIGLQHQFVVKYDEFDPNTDVQGSDIGAAGKRLDIGDIKYSTLGFGWIYHWDANVKITLYYDMVKNETVNASATGALTAFKKDINDDVLTCRIQYKF
jgi:hypothetical protein